MEYDLSDELKMLKQMVRKFVDTELIPVEMNTLTPDMKLKPEYRKRFEDKTKELGLWQIDVPVEYGGLGMGMLAEMVVVEEIARTIALPPRGGRITGPEVRPALYNLSAEMKERYVDFH